MIPRWKRGIYETPEGGEVYIKKAPIPMEATAIKPEPATRKDMRDIKPGEVVSQVRGIPQKSLGITPLEAISPIYFMYNRSLSPAGGIKTLLFSNPEEQKKRLYDFAYVTGAVDKGGQPTNTEIYKFFTSVGKTAQGLGMGYSPTTGFNFSPTISGLAGTLGGGLGLPDIDWGKVALYGGLILGALFVLPRLLK